MESEKTFYQTFFTKQAIRVIGGGLLIQLVLGYFYLWTPISAYITSYFREKNKNLSNELTNIVQPSLALSKALVMPLGAFINTRLGSRKTTMIFGFILLLAFLHSSICNDFWYFYIDYSIIGGIVNGCLVMLPIYQVQKYFANYKGIATGIIFSGYGLGSIIWSQLSYRIINPYNIEAEKDSITGKKYYPYDKVSENVPYGLQVLGISFFVSLVITSIITFIDIKKDPISQEKSTKKEESKPFVQNQSQEKKNEKTYAELLLSKQFLAFISMALLSSLFPMTLINHYRLFSLELHNDDKFLTNIVVTSTSVANGFSRIIWGWIYDKIGFHYSFLTNIICQLILILLFIPFAPSHIGFTVVVSYSFFCQGGTFLLFPLSVLEFFGQNDGQKIYGFVHYAFSFANFLQFYIIFYFKDKYGMSVVLSIFFVSTAFACLIKLAFNQKKKTE